MKKLTFPKASKPLSKKRITPSNENKMPNPIRPKPISAILQNNLRYKTHIFLQKMPVN